MDRHKTNIEGSPLIQDIKELYYGYYTFSWEQKDNNSNKQNKQNTDLFDDAFARSLLLYDGTENILHLLDDLWKNCQYPIACCMVAMIFYKRVNKLSFMPNLMKNKLKDLIE